MLLLLLVNLQITEDGILNIRTGGISAQTMLEETLDDLTVIGSSPYDYCSWCGERVRKDSLNIHFQQYCKYRSMTCQTCYQLFYLSDGHICNGTRCSQCGYDANNCKCGPYITGNNNSGGGSPSGSSGDSGHTGGGSNSSGSSSSSGGSSPSSSDNNSYVKIRIDDFNISFDNGADQLVNNRLLDYLKKVVDSAKRRGIKSIRISSTTNHNSNKTKSAHSMANGARALDINYIDGVHVSQNNEKARIIQEIIKNTPGYLENYGPFIINKINNGNPINAPWARNIKNGHYDHIHISIPK